MPVLGPSALWPPPKPVLAHWGFAGLCLLSWVGPVSRLFLLFQLPGRLNEATRVAWRKN